MSRQFILYRKIAMMRLLCCLALLGAFVMPAAADIPYINGQFDTPTTTPSGYQQISGAVIPLWTVTRGKVDWISTLWAPPPLGGFSVDLNGTGPGGITSSVHLAPGQYLLSFYLAGYAPSNGVDKLVDVAAGTVTASSAQGFFDVKAGQSVETAEAVGAAGALRALTWTHETLQFSVTSSSSNTIAFRSLAGNGLYGPVVGDVSLKSLTPSPRVPEAGFYSAFALNLGGLLLSGGFLLVRQRRKA